MRFKEMGTLMGMRMLGARDANFSYVVSCDNGEWRASRKPLTPGLDTKHYGPFGTRREAERSVSLD